MKGIKLVVKSIQRELNYSRLSRRSVWTDEAAEFWAEKMRKRPDLYAEKPFVTQVQVHNGMSMQAGLIDVIERNLIVRGEWDIRIGAFIKNNLRKGETFIDVGANIGYFSLLASKIVGAEGRVICFEPNVVNLQKLAKHLLINDVSNAAVLSIGLGDKNVTTQIHFPTFNNAGAASLIRFDRNQQSNQTFIGRADEIFVAYGVVPDLIKMDIEGSELNCLRGMEECLRRHRPKVVLELTDRLLKRLGGSSYELLELMASLDYRCKLLTPISGMEFGADLDSSHSNAIQHQLDVCFYHREDSVRL